MRLADAVENLLRAMREVPLDEQLADADRLGELFAEEARRAEQHEPMSEPGKYTPGFSVVSAVYCEHVLPVLVAQVRSAHAQAPAVVVTKKRSYKKRLRAQKARARR